MEEEIRFFFTVSFGLVFSQFSAGFSISFQSVSSRFFSQLSICQSAFSKPVSHSMSAMSALRRLVSRSFTLFSGASHTPD